MEWIKVDKFGEVPLEKPFLVSDEYENVTLGFNSFDYYDASYWFPLPKYPMSKGTITNDECVTLLLKQNENV